VVLNDLHDHLDAVLRRAQTAGEGLDGGQRVLHFLGHAQEHGRAEDAQSDGHGMRKKTWGLAVLQSQGAIASTALVAHQRGDPLGKECKNACAQSARKPGPNKAGDG